MKSNDNIAEEGVVNSLEIHRGLGRVEGKLDQIIAGMTLHEDRDQLRFTDVALQIKDINIRIGITERKIYLWSGGLAVLVFLVSHFPFAQLISKLTQ